MSGSERTQTVGWDAPTGNPVHSGLRAGSGWSRGRTVAVVLAALLVVVGAGVGVGGAAVLLLDGNRDAGYVMTGHERLQTASAAVVQDDLAVVVDSPAWLAGSVLDAPSQIGALRVDVTPRSDAPLFLGIAHSDDVTAYLAGTAHDQLTDWTRSPAYDRTPGAPTASMPAEQPWWTAQATAAEPFTLTWETTEGEWAVVLLNADGSAGFTADVRVGATAPHLRTIGLGLVALAGALLVLGILGVALAAAGTGRRTG